MSSFAWTCIGLLLRSLLRRHRLIKESGLKIFAFDGLDEGTNQLHVSLL